MFPAAAIDYIQFLHKEKKKQEEEMSMLRKEVMALKIMKTLVAGKKNLLLQWYDKTSKRESCRVNIKDISCDNLNYTYLI